MKCLGGTPTGVGDEDDTVLQCCLVGGKGEVT